MKNSNVMRTLISSFVLIFTSISIHAANTDFKDWDTDNDGLIERHEFTDKFISEYFNQWNPDDEAGLIEEGFFRESYAGLDTDNDNFLSDEEWLIGFNYFYEDYIIYEDVDVIDFNEDGKISFDEYYDVVYDTEYFTDIDLDADNYISEFELANYVFDNWDFNESGTISRSEFNQFEWYYLDV